MESRIKNNLNDITYTAEPIPFFSEYISYSISERTGLIRANNLLIPFGIRKLCAH